MNSLLTTASRNKFQVLAAGILIGAIIIASKGAALGIFKGLLRFALPFLGIYGLFVFAKIRFKKALGGKTFGDVIGKYQTEFQRQQAQKQGGTVIDMCPKCGDVIKNQNHVCKK